MKFTEAAETVKTPAVPPTLVSPDCQRAALAFQATVERTLALLVLPGYAFLVGHMWAEAHNAAIAFEQWATCRLDFTPEMLNQIGRRAQNSFREMWIAESQRSSLDMVLGMTHNLEALSWQGGPVMRDALAHTLKGLVVMMWAAFEVLAGDLYEDVTTARPQLRAALSSTKNKAIGFQKLKYIRDSYDVTFAPDNAAIVAALAPVSLSDTAILRNLIVHSNGFIDPVFLKKDQSVISIPHIAALGKGDEVDFNGDLVRSLIDPIPHLGYALLTAIDQWLQTHP